MRVPEYDGDGQWLETQHVEEKQRIVEAGRRDEETSLVSGSDATTAIYGSKFRRRPDARLYQPWPGLPVAGEDASTVVLFADAARSPVAHIHLNALLFSERVVPGGARCPRP